MTEERYPLALSLNDKSCAIVGLGQVGQRKVQGLLDLGESAPKRITIYDPYATEAQIPRTNYPIVLQKRPVTDTDLCEHALVFACTNDPRENTRIARFCRAHGILCNSASEPSEGDVALPSVLRCEHLLLTLSTHGASPALAKKWRRELTAWAERKRPMLRCMARIRPLVQGCHRPSAENTDLFRTLAQGPLEELLTRADTRAAEDYLRATLPPELRNAIPELLYDLL